MIRRTLDDGDLLIPQHEHALHAGRLAARLRDLPEPREACVRAAELHDSGWPLLDDEPRLQPDGRPPHVFEGEPAWSRPAWRRSVAIARAAGEQEALLVAGHFARLRREFADETADLRAAWRLGTDRRFEADGIAVLHLCDALSLTVLCNPGESVQPPHGYAVTPEGEVSPWPFLSDRVEDMVTGRLVERRKWASQAEFRAAFDAAPTRELAVAFVPAAG